jgi:hypothetical protein
MAGDAPDKERARDAFVRWQGRTVDQLGSVSNLILGLSTAAIGLLATALVDGRVPAVGWSRWAFLFALLCELVATVSGVALAWNRLLDFRATMNSAKARLRQETDQLPGLREETQVLGEATWRMLKVQTASFIAGVLATTAYAVMQS